MNPHTFTLIYPPVQHILVFEERSMVRNRPFVLRFRRVRWRDLVEMGVPTPIFRESCPALSVGNAGSPVP